MSQLDHREVRRRHLYLVQPLSDPVPKYTYPSESDSVAALPIDTYDKWWKQQINDKTRNMVRKAGKKEVAIRIVGFDDKLVEGIAEIYNESPLRQGKRFRHYGKDFQTLKAAHATYLERSIFIGPSTRKSSSVLLK